MADAKADIALIGLAVMGQNIILNMDDHGFVVCAYNRTVEKVEQFLQNEAKGTKVVGAKSLEDMVAKLKQPRKVMMLVKAGAAVDSTVRQLVPLLQPGDIIIDGGNSQYADTQRWCDELRPTGILYVGMGVSGGEEGARHGPSLMPGGHEAAWPHLAPIFQAICARANGEPCCGWVGDGGAGHFVKMVHNGIEYGDMQLICETYHLMKDLLGLDNEQMSRTFAQWNEGLLDSYLIEITSDILQYKDADGAYLVEKILDCAGQKGTGKWTGIAALEHGVPVTLIGEAVFARCLSALKAERAKASGVLRGPPRRPNEGALPVADLCQALYVSKIISYAQGFMLLKEAAKVNGWQLNYGEVALMWRGGCIIRSAFLGKIKEAFEADPSLESLLLSPYFSAAANEGAAALRRAVAAAVTGGVPVPALSAAVAFLDGYRSARLPANLLQAQRDYFGAHTYELAQQPGAPRHTDWTGRGGKTSASTYNN